MKKALAAAALVLVGGTAVACGGGAPTNASKEDFCDAYGSIFEDAIELGEADHATRLARIREYATELQQVGTPEDIPDDARAGFERSVEAILSLDDDATQEELERIEAEYSAEEKEQAEAFGKYTADTCGSPMDQLDLPEVPAE